MDETERINALIDDKYILLKETLKEEDMVSSTVSKVENGSIYPPIR